MKPHRWCDIEREQMNPHFARQVIHGSHMTVARVFLCKGAVVPVHSHPNEQITLLESGKLRFEMNDKSIPVEAGEAMRVPPGMPHLVEALEDSVATDLFSPVREDWIQGDDAYLRK